MSTNITFNALQQDVQNYLERGASPVTDPAVFAQIPREINGAERDLVTMLKLQGEKEYLFDLSGFIANLGVYAKPDRWLNTVSINFGTGTNANKRKFLYPRAYEYARAYWPDDSLTKPPRFYADYGLNNWLIVPTPDQTYPVEFCCYMQPVLLDSGNQENFLTIYCGNALLYRTLLRMAPFLKGDQRLPMWKGLFDEQMSWLGLQDLQKILDASAQRERA